MENGVVDGLARHVLAQVRTVSVFPDPDVRPSASATRKDPSLGGSRRFGPAWKGYHFRFETDLTDEEWA